jgi:hypothetical protein
MISKFYNNTIRNVVIAFGSVFNDIYISRRDSAGKVSQTMKIPLAYGPKQKWLARLREDPDVNKKVAVTLPRIGFEITSLAYDSTRKLNKLIKLKKVANPNEANSVYMPIPYNIDFSLDVFAKNSDDALQIVEQILPYFQPEYTVTMREHPDMDIIRDVPIVLNSIDYEDNYSGEWSERRAIIYSLSFTAKFHLYGPTSTAKVIKKVEVDQYTDLPENMPKREQKLTVTPNPITAEATDDFGFNEEISFYQDAGD